MKQERLNNWKRNTATRNIHSCTFTGYSVLLLLSFILHIEVLKTAQEKIDEQASAKTTDIVWANGSLITCNRQRSSTQIMN